jgi:hypothetical protein
LLIAAGRCLKIAGKQTGDEKNLTGDETEKSIFETHHPVFENWFTENDNCFMRDSTRFTTAFAKTHGRRVSYHRK